MKTIQAREKLKAMLKPEFHNYIDTELAGDFAHQLVKAIEKLQQQKPLSEEEILSILRNELGISMKDCGIFKAFCKFVEEKHGIS